MSDPDISTFTYRPLQRDFSIRLIELHSAAEKDAALVCSIIHVDLFDDETSHPPYAALSYAWGSSQKLHTLFCGSSRLPITESLNSALRAVRKRSWNILIWVDAVCIDQNNVLERNRQVANMIHVYSQASTVLVWTGEDDSRRMGAKCLEWLELIGRSPIRGLQCEIREPEMAALEQFFGRSWFMRRWVIQEVGVATTVFIICGEKRIAWYDFIEAVGILRWRHDLAASDAYHDTLSKLCMIEELNKRTRVSGAGNGKSLLDLLLHFETSRCSDDRDRIFSLIRLATEDEPTLSELAATVDYSLSAEKVYLGMAKALLSPANDYALLHLAASFQPEDKSTNVLPSWVPDWRHPCRFQPLSKSDFRCGMGFKSEINVYENGELEVLGCILDSITEKSHQLERSQKALGQIATASEALVSEHRSRERQLLRVKLIPEDRDVRDASFESHFRKLASASRLLEDTMEAKTSSFDAISPAHGVDNAIEPLGSNIQHEIKQHILRGRKIFVTGKGRLGIGPTDVRVGDAVVVIFGLRTPFILRKDGSGSRWRLIGDAYVAGITNKAVRPRGSAHTKFQII